jgi:GNAT superfamily N-acetyltransferase
MECTYRQLTDYEAVHAGIDLWNRVHPAFAIPDRLVAQNVFTPFAGLDVTAWGGFSGDDLIAFALGKRLTAPISDYADPDQGWVSLLAVDPALEDRVVTSDLLATVERAMIDTGVSSLRFGGDPGQFLPGLPISFADTRAALRDRRFETGERVYDLQRDIASFEPPAHVDRVEDAWSGLSLERVDSTESLLWFLADQFPGRWHYEAVNVCRLPGGEREYWLLSHEGTTVGFARTNTPESAYRGSNVNWSARFDGTVCGLGPLGIHESYRGRGWGLWMIANLVEHYRDSDYDRMIIDWTELVDYYGTLGFEPWLTYDTFTKEVSQ